MQFNKLRQHIAFSHQIEVLYHPKFYYHIFKENKKLLSHILSFNKP